MTGPNTDPKNAGQKPGQKPAQKKSPNEITGRHVLLAMLAFFGVIFAVNGTFLYRAIGTYTGVVSNEPYRKGLEYNKRIADEERQQALGWKHNIALSPDGQLRIAFDGASPQALAGLSLSGTVGRPSTAAQDVSVILAEGRPGEYLADVGKLGDGNWLVTAEATRPLPQGSAAEAEAEVVYRIKERVWLKR